MLGVEQKEVGVCPHIARIRRDEKRKIADQSKVLCARVRLQPRALAEQQELGEANLLELERQFSPDPFDRSGRATYEIIGPLQIIGTRIPAFQRPEERVVVQ